MQGLALDVKVLTEDKQEIQLKEISDEVKENIDMRAEKKKSQQEVEVELEDPYLGTNDIEGDLMGATQVVEDVDSLFDLDDDI